MSPRRSYKTINLPVEVVEWIDSLVSPHARKGGPGPLGIQSRDEFVRIAVAILGAAIDPDNRDDIPLDYIQALVRQLEEERAKKGSTANPS
ncbi:MAG: hypothetical protein ACYC2H_01095 [Thermoplasmatota archaeon]